jgi:CRISPR-associated protein Cas1
MQTLYVSDNGALLKKKSNRILLKKDNKILEEIPILDLKRVIIFGNNQVSTQLLQYFATKGIDVAFLSSSGR